MVKTITGKQEILADLEKRVNNKILEQSNFDLLKKLIENADTLDEAIKIAELGTTYKRTGFHFDKRLERRSDTIAYFRKNEALSFVTDPNAITHKLIVGDNYPALLNLLIEYKGRIDVIYIDPPYGKDSMGEFAETNYDNAITRDNLLSMLYPRLYVAKQLLSDSGVIFCSIDDKNHAYAKCLFDEVFEERNFVTEFAWEKKKKPSFLHRNVGKLNEYILCYTKNCNLSEPFSVDITTLGKKYPFNNAGNGIGILTFPAGYVRFGITDGVIKPQDMSSGNIITELLDPLEIKNGRNIGKFRLKGEWRYSQAKLNEIVTNGEGITISQIPFRPNHIKVGGKIKKMKNVLSPTHYKMETNEDATTQLIEILSVDIFENPKPIKLIYYLVKATTYYNSEAIVLDFFAGSGTTGQAVLELNKADKGHRQFILATSNEITPTTPNGIVLDVTSKRLKRVMTGKCFDGTTDFEWAKNNKPLGDNLLVLDVAEVSNFESVAGKTPFDVIDETLYGNEKFKTVKDKVEWVCNNFEKTQKRLEEK